MDERRRDWSLGHAPLKSGNGDRDGLGGKGINRDGQGRAGSRALLLPSRLNPTTTVPGNEVNRLSGRCGGWRTSFAGKHTAEMGRGAARAAALVFRTEEGGSTVAPAVRWRSSSLTVRVCAPRLPPLASGNPAHALTHAAGLGWGGR